MGRNIPVGNFLGGNFSGRDSPGGSLMGGNFPGESFPGGIFLEPILLLITGSQFIAFFKSSFFTSKISQSIYSFLYDNVTWKLLSIIFIFVYFFCVLLHCMCSLLLTPQHFFCTYNLTQSTLKVKIPTPI